ncbi:MAG: hypothetical protein BroJett004_11410 [Planctomycetota bacterium]|nr:MAG: hypothetical protein BroJett004_11410 [Planctomycetota bacterium]
MQQQQPDPIVSKKDFNQFLGVLTFIARTFAVTVEVFLRRADSFGQRYFAMQAAAAFVLILVWPAFWEGHSAEPMLVFLLLYWLALLRARICTAARVRRGGPQPHSLYNGAPVLQRVFRRTPEQRIKAGLEFLVVFLVGALLLAVSEPLGAYLMFAAFGAGATSGMSGALQHRRSLDLHDAFVEQRDAAEAFRRMRGE